MSFNSRTREGCDGIKVIVLGEQELFQFTHPGGVRRRPSCAPWRGTWFQFTHPGGVRL